MKPLQPAWLITKCIHLQNIFVLLLLGTTTIFAQSPDLILTNGKIFTSDTSQLYVQALAIKGNLIMATGTSTTIENLASRQTRKIDLKGKTVVPGFNDAHDHLSWRSPIGQFFSAEFSVSGPSKMVVLDSVSRLIKRAKPNQWIYGDIGLTILYNKNIRKSLDSLAPDHPVALQIMWGHGLVLNSKALQILGIYETAPDPLGGWYQRKPGTDSITGALYEYAQWPAWQAIRISESANLIKALRSYAQKQVQFGITTVQDMSCNIKPETIPRIFKEANLPLRVRIIPFPGTTYKGRNLAEWNDVNTHPSTLTYISGRKYLIDGTPFEQTALLKKSYHDKPDWYGRLDMHIDTIRQILQEALTSNTQLMMHIVGDSTLSLVLPLMKQMATDAVWKTKRVRIEHNPTRNSTELDRKHIRDMGIIMAHTPQYGHNSPIGSLMNQGIKVVMAPDGLINPFVNIQIITSQQTNPKENITREQAVIAYTHGTAYAEFTENQKGTLIKGKLADLAILSQDIFTIPTQQLPATHSVLTMVDGKIVYLQPQIK